MSCRLLGFELKGGREQSALLCWEPRVAYDAVGTEGEGPFGPAPYLPGE